ncbi:hypothetical protein R5H30_00370 [Sulfitobacter sp. D35]|nr:hypothetical protein [Sulfitobacter sp. D35]MDW4496417.1 hypothetical protein [Sulfitobacter sp. D35]
MELFLRRLVARYPENELQIVRLAREDPEFHSVCEEIELAESAAKR